MIVRTCGRAAMQASREEVISVLDGIGVHTFGGFMDAIFGLAPHGVIANNP